MILRTPSCPKCGLPAIGTCESVPSIAMFDGDPAAGAVEFSGEVRLCDGSETNTDADGRIFVQCEQGHEWTCAIDDTP